MSHNISCGGERQMGSNKHKNNKTQDNKKQQNQNQNANRREEFAEELNVNNNKQKIRTNNK